jgi:hypothetical protein
MPGGGDGRMRGGIWRAGSICGIGNAAGGCVQGKDEERVRRGRGGWKCLFGLKWVEHLVELPLVRRRLHAE